MNFTRNNVSDGDAGILEILGTLAALRDFYGAQPAIRRAALAIVGTVGDHEQEAQAARLAAFVRRAVVYVADPLDAELIQTPDVMLLEIHRRGTVAGDCDCHCLLFASLAQSLGMPCQIAGAKLDAANFNHVVCVLTLDAGELVFDLCAKGRGQPEHSELLFA